jgi:hypothetical protein
MPVNEGARKVSMKELQITVAAGLELACLLSLNESK